MVGMLSDIGEKRHNNQDYIQCYEDETKRLYVVADGMGGYNAGEVASKLAVDKIIEYVKNKNKIEDISQTIIDAIKYANVEVFHLSCREDIYKGMGTTVTACLIIKDKMAVGNVGDSSCYVTKGKGIHKVTKDHSLVQQLIDNGAITKEEAFNHPNRNVITRAVGTRYSVKVDVFNVELENIEKVILCTDGLTKEMTEEEIYKIVDSCKENQTICKELIKECKKRDAKDNISVIVFEGEGKE